MKSAVLAGSAALLFLATASAQPSPEERSEVTPAPAPSSTPEAPTVTTPESPPARQVLALAKRDARVGSLDSRFCDISSDGSREVVKGAALVLVAAETCRPAYGSSMKQFYRVAVRGHIGYIEADSVFVRPSDAAYVATLGPEVSAEFARAAEEQSKAFRAIELKKALESIDRVRPKGIALLDYRVYDVSEYTQGTGFRFSVLNPTKKVIKYVSATVIGLNAVNDPVRSPRGTSVTVRGIGPIEPNESGEYSFDYVWHTDVVESARLVSLKVEYMDGTSRMIASPRDVLLPEATVQILKTDND